MPPGNYSGYPPHQQMNMNGPPAGHQYGSNATNLKTPKQARFCERLSLRTKLISLPELVLTYIHSVLKQICRIDVRNKFRVQKYQQSCK